MEWVEYPGVYMCGLTGHYSSLKNSLLYHPRRVDGTNKTYT